jgi:TonB family protein
MNEKKRFRLIILISLAVHFFFVLFFPAWGVSIKPPLEYVEVSLVKPRPVPAPKPVVKKASAEKPAAKPVEKKVVATAKKEEKPPSVKLTSPAKKEAEQPKKVAAEASEVTPVVEKSIEPALPEVSPVKISAQSAQKLPAIPPRVSMRSEIEVPLVEQSLEPTLGGGRGGLHPLAEAKGVEQGKERLFSGERSSKDREGFPQGIDLPAKVTSYAKGELSSYEEEAGEGLAGSGQGPEIEGPMAGREIQRWVEPGFPRSAEEQGKMDGKVRVKFWVLSSGEVVETAIMQTSNVPEFDQDASRALSKSRFEEIKEEERQWGIVTFYFEKK